MTKEEDATKKKLAEEEATKKKAEEEEAQKKKDEEEAAAKAKQNAIEAEARKKELSDVKTLGQAQQLLETAADTIDVKNAEIQKLSTSKDAEIKELNETHKTEVQALSKEVKDLKVKADKYEKLMVTEKEETIDALVGKKLSLGVIEKKDVDDQKKSLGFIDIKVIKMMAKDLENIKSVVRKESMKGHEGTTEEVAEKQAKIKQMMENAAFSDEFIKEHLKLKGE